MFFSNVSIAEKYNYLEEKFICAYKWLAETDIKSLTAGSYPIIGDTVVANVQEYITLPASQDSFEAHEECFDIQYIVSGREQFRVCKRDGLVEKEHNETDGLIFYEEPEFSGSVFLEEGDLIVAASKDAYKSRCQTGGPCEVKKVVVKAVL